MSSTLATANKGMQRIHLTLPPDLYYRFNEEIKSKNLQKVEAIRIAIEAWLDSQVSKKMAAGYIALAEENLSMLKEFESVDNENWL